MNCLKCGREVPGEQVFCENCLLEMEKYPVKPGTVVQLPRHRDNAGLKKSPKRRAVPLEEQVKLLRKRLWTQTILLLLALVVILVLAIPAAQYLMEDHFLPGQNYSTIIVTTTPDETTEAVEPSE